MVDPKNVHSMIGKHMLADGMEQVIDLNKSHGSWSVSYTHLTLPTKA